MVLPSNVNLIISQVYDVRIPCYFPQLYPYVFLPPHAGADGFVYTSIAVGDHNITVRGTTRDGQVGELNLGVTAGTPSVITIRNTDDYRKLIL